MDTVWVLGDQLNRHSGALATAQPHTHRVLIVESLGALRGRRWHRQRAHLVLTGLRRLTAELRAEGFEVDHRVAPSMADGLAEHRKAYAPNRVVAMEPASWDGRERLTNGGVDLVPNDQFLTSTTDLGSWAHGRKQVKLEDFYRWQRRRLGYLMDGDEPVTGRWNYDAENRERPPKDGRNHWPEPVRDDLDDLDQQVLADLDRWGVTTWGEEPAGWWPTSRERALARLDHFIEHLLPRFGPHEDAMLTSSWHLAHSMLSPALNLGMVHPREVCDRVEDAYRSGRVPIASAEGFLRQVIGWREYVWGLYWWWGPSYRHENALGATDPVPPAFTGAAPTRMRCVATTVDDLEQRGWAHHIQRLMVLGNLSLLAGVDPWQLTRWMWENFVDGAEWVMLPNVIGMSQHADGGRMATKPYISGGAYIDKMSDYCRGCYYDRTARTGDRACPFTTLYWDFLDRHRTRFERNPRIVTQVRAAQKLADLDQVRIRAVEVRQALRDGTL
jgi:deoxyribodipyrimidine photolyase-related protein